MGIKSDYLRVLQIINENMPEISFKLLYQKIVDLNDERFQMWTRGSFYSVIKTLKDKNYISTRKLKKTPTSMIIKITNEAQDMLKIFESGLNHDIKKINGKKEIKEIKKKEEKIIIQKEMRDLDEDEIAECVQEVVYKIIDVIDMDIEELTREEGKKYSIVAEKIVRYVRNY